MLRPWQRWLYFSQWLIAAGAAAQCWLTGHWLHLPVVSAWLIVFVFCSTLLVYLFHFRFYRIKKPANDRQLFFVQHRSSLLVQFIIGMAVLPFAFFYTGIHFLLPVGIVAVCACAYTYFTLKPRHYGIFRYNGLFKILTLSFVWMAVTSLLPVAASGKAVFAPPYLLYYALRWLFMLAICLPFDVRDMHSDQRSGNRTIPVLLGVKVTFRLCYVCLVLHAVLPFIGVLYNWYNVDVVLANIVATALTTACIYYSSRHLSDDFSWFLLDSNFVLRAAIIGSVLIF